ncbi:hypothetical protein [Corynebacterium sp. CCM 9203]|uniref:hypothetical protein n=1 Tax=Corynebacterium sp. CCM 9203 TaxID=3057615 RepID=UPI003525784F
MIAAHGCSVIVTGQRVTVHNDPLLTALRGPGPEIPLASITDVTVIPGDSVTCARVLLEGSGAEIVFSPNQTTELQRFVDALAAAGSGDLPDVEIPGLDFSAIHVKHDISWDGISGIGVASVRNGVVVDSTEWTSTGTTGSAAEALIAALGEYLTDSPGPLVAHNAYRQATALIRTLRSTGASSVLSGCPLGCTLAIAREVRPDDTDHSLGGLCTTFGIPEPDSAAAAAEATARILVLLRDSRGGTASGTTVDEIHTGAGFTLGRVEDERVWPVLVTAPGKAPRTASSHSGRSEKERGSRAVPWAKVAVPDTIPEPNPDADHEGLLFGQNVTLSGDFGAFDKGRLWQEIAEAGATVGKNVTRKTTILVCGEWGKPTSKQKRAEELISKGQEIALWSAEQLYTTLGLDPAEEEDLQPPF